MKSKKNATSEGIPNPPTIWFFGTDFAPLCVFMGYFGVLVFWCFAWLTFLYGQKVGNPLEIGPFSVADWGFEP
jgi:hypothetical protein